MKCAAYLSAALLLGCAHAPKHGPALEHIWPWGHEQEIPADPLARTEIEQPNPPYHPPILYFAFNSAKLRDTEYAKLDEMLAHLSGACRVEGYASPEGTDEYNLALSAQRAEIVAAYLRISPRLTLEVRPLGEEGRVDNDDPDLYWLDRRALVVCP